MEWNAPVAGQELPRPRGTRIVRQPMPQRFVPARPEFAMFDEPDFPEIQDNEGVA